MTLTVVTTTIYILFSLSNHSFDFNQNGLYISPLVCKKTLIYICITKLKNVDKKIQNGGSNVLNRPSFTMLLCAFVFINYNQNDLSLTMKTANERFALCFSDKSNNTVKQFTNGFCDKLEFERRPPCLFWCLVFSLHVIISCCLIILCVFQFIVSKFFNAFNNKNSFSV